MTESSEKWLPPEFFTPNDLQKMMRDPCYWRDRDPEFIKKVTRGFKLVYGDGEKKNVLERANLIVQQRGTNYGHPYDDFKKTAMIWSAILGIDVRPDQVALCMMGVKLSRLVQTPHHQDSIDDIAGYTWCLDEVVKKTKEILKCDTDLSLTQSKRSSSQKKT